MSSVIDQILNPTVLSSLREDISLHNDESRSVPPVQCMIWKGDNQYDIITFDNVYPFDTIDHIKYMICSHFKDNSAFIPRFLFVGIPVGDDAYITETPDMNTIKYIPLEYLWYPHDSNDSSDTYELNHPRYTLIHSDLRFVTSDGSYASPNHVIRGRSTLEQVFLKARDGQLPVFHVFPLKQVLREYRGAKPVGEEEWNKKFAPYFPEISIQGPYEADADDIEFAKKINFFITQRTNTIDRVNQLLEDNVEYPSIKLTGIRQLLLTWKKPVRDFEGNANLFYRIRATETRPYLRLLPADGSGITKLHVKGIIPIPTLDDPRVLENWGKETSFTPGMDFCTIKYVHRPQLGITPPIYGTVQILHDGTMKLLLQPPKQVRKLDPNVDFRHFNSVLGNVFDDITHQNIRMYELREIAALFGMNIGMKSKRFTKARIQQRLPYFQAFFKEIQPLPEDNPLISLRFKAVSQYASEDKVFSFITQYTTDKALDGEAPDVGMIDAIQNEFQFSKKEATKAFAEWFQKRGDFTVQIPEEGEFMESFNPGIDIHIYAQHPSYFFHVNRIDNYETYKRVFTLLSLLFIEEDDYFLEFSTVSEDEMAEIEEELEEKSIEREEPSKRMNRPSAENMSLKNAAKPDQNTISAVPDWILTDMYANESNAVNANEVLPEDVPEPIQVAAKPAVSTDIKPKKKPTMVESSKIPQEAVKGKEEEKGQKLVNPKSWFISKLQEIDKRLFDYDTDVKGESGYSRQCAGHDDRQPAILTKDQYDRMREIYEDDNIFWIVYPLEGASDPVQPIGSEETITIMRYGSDANNINYYFCPKFFCLSDEIMIRESDFISTVDRDGNPKPPNTCPFCYGKLIENRKKGVPGYTVIKRKQQTYHKYIDFLKKTSHPENFSLPCCFLKQSTLRISDPSFSHIRDSLQQEMISENQIPENEDEKSEYSELVFRADQVIEYAVLFESIHKSYILDSNKQPDPGVFAAVSHQFDTFFQQNSGDKIVTRVMIKLKIRPNAVGFLRIGTENTINESLLGVIAPLIYKNSIAEVKERILEVMIPRVFLNSHFGNLVLEFYNPTDGSAMPPTHQELMLWSRRELGISLNSTNLYALIRIYNAYKRFIRFIHDPLQRKDLRHIQPILAEPGLFTTRGIQLVVMEDNGDQPITIKCPTFGVSADRNRKNDFVFVSRTMKTIGKTNNQYAKYELFIHTSNKPAKGGEGEIHETIIRWDYQSRQYWPDIVKLRVDEYMTQCQSRYRSIYTSQQGIHSMAMIPLSKAAESSPFIPEGIIKDNYNHIVGITFRTKPGSPHLVALPVIDDGVISISSAFSIKNIYLDWADFKAAPVEDVIQYYDTVLAPLFSLYPGYTIKYMVRQKLDDKIVAVQLNNGIYIPVAPPKNQKEFDKIKLDTVTIEQFEWEINKQLSGVPSNSNISNWNSLLESTSTNKQCGSDPEIQMESSDAQFEELYQSFRIMFSNWITSQEAGSSFRKSIEEIIFNSKLPEYERRKRLYLLISSTLLSWFFPDPNHWENHSTSFLRKDCRIIDQEESCTGSCKWKVEDDMLHEGRCLLHVPDKKNLSEIKGDREVNTSELFTKRIIDELVRFPIRRKQLMRKNEISKMSSIIQPIHDGDQYIIPESSTTWANLLRLDWTRQNPEEPKYYEEMSREATENDHILPSGTLPKRLQSVLGKNTPFRLKTPSVVNESKPLVAFTGILGISLESMGLDEDSTSLTMDNLNKYVLTTSKPIGLFDLRDDNIVQFVRPFKGSYDTVTIFVFLSDQIGLLAEEDGNPEVTIDLLPERVKDRWQDAHIIRVKKTKVKVANEPQPNMGMVLNTKKIQPPLASKASSSNIVKKKKSKPELVVESSPSMKEAKKKVKPSLINNSIKNAPVSSIAASASASASASTFMNKPQKRNKRILHSQLTKM